MCEIALEEVCVLFLNQFEVPIDYKKKWERRERLRYAFRKHGYELDVPKLGG